MPQAPPRRPPRRQEILQAVYEDNRAGGRPPEPRRSARAAAPTARRGPRWLALGLLAAAVVGLGTWGVLQMADPPVGPEPPAVASNAPVDNLDALGSGPVGSASRPPAGPAGADAGVADLLNLQVRTIVIDPGHGGEDPGAVGPNRLLEKSVTLDVARRLRDRLAAHGTFRVLLTRDGDETVGLGERVAFANEAGADLYVSVHVNALADPAHAPVETYYFGVEADSAARALAREANRGSAFSVADFNAAIRRAGTAVKLQESQKLARTVQRALVDQRALAVRRWVDGGAKPAPFAVLLHTEAPAVLAEITALSNPAEEARLRTPAHRDAIAAALEAGVLAYLRRPLPPADPDHAREED